MSLAELLHNLREQLPPLQERYHVETLRVFGSYVCHEQNTDSDLDILVTFTELPGLLDFIALENYLTDTLGIQVDLVLEDSLKPALSPIIQAELLSPPIITSQRVILRPKAEESPQRLITPA